ncbi:MAG: PadR family transcriptional regulator [Actinomycetota bacterium]|nr:PadR family transcriptional regulator [Actinomycetota bacterium]
MARRRESATWAEPALLVLGSLADGPKHGYAIIQAVAAESGISLGPGTLYAALSRMEEQGLIVAEPGDERRRPYRMTGAGQRLLAERLSAMAAFAQTGLARLAVQS